MSASNSNRVKTSSKSRLAYGEALERIKPEKANKQQRRKTRYNWE